MQKNQYPLGLTLVAIFAIIAGVGEVIVGITGNYLGILSKNISPSVATAIIGSFYSFGGIFLLIRKKWGAMLGIGFISAEILGRIYLIIIGIAPAHGIDAVKILIGGIIAVLLIAYVIYMWKYFK
ncbi:MAG TPA: hypothetical protein VF941_15475 [Clostridia bacterium]